MPLVLPDALERWIDAEHRPSAEPGRLARPSSICLLRATPIRQPAATPSGQAPSARRPSPDGTNGVVLTTLLETGNSATTWHKAARQFCSATPLGPPRTLGVYQLPSRSRDQTQTSASSSLCLSEAPRAYITRRRPTQSGVVYSSQDKRLYTPTYTMSVTSPSAAKLDLPALPLPAGVSANYVHCPSNGLTFHFLEAGYTPARDRPLLLLCHGYPELAFSWRKIMPSLADAGYYVVAFDQRGYGRTTGWDDSTYAKVDLSQFTVTNLVRDTVVFVNAVGYSQVKCVVGHDFGAVTASMCALMRPDMFKSVVMMSHPFRAPGGLPFNLAHGENPTSQPPPDIQRELAKLSEPRKHYKWYNSTAVAAFQWSVPLQGLEAFLRGYIHVKSADCANNNPFPLEGWQASELAKMPYYYIMPLHSSMPETVAAMMETEDANSTKRWLSDEDLAVYVREWTRTGFQGGLNWYRGTTDPSTAHDLDLFAGKKIDCPATFISGAQDWGNYQDPGVIENYPNACTKFKGVKLIDGAGHWPQQEQPDKVVQEILGFLSGL